MKAVVIDEFGGPEVLHVADRELPEPGSGQVRVRVRASGLNPMDRKVRSGEMQQMFPTELPTVLGVEVSGTVDAVGPEVDGLSVGEEVLGFADGGGYAEYALATTVAPKPDGLEWAAAAALPVAAETALRVLGLLGVTRGDTVLIHGAAGGVGTVAVQLAVSRGAGVIGTASEANHDYLRGLGAVPVVYGDGLVERVRAVAPDGIDAVFDVAGKGALEDSIELRGGKSRIVTIADPAAFGLDIPFSSGGERDAEALAELARQAADGRLRLTVAETYPLEETSVAHEVLDTGHGRGKIVLLVN
ncbi:MAG: NADP-dependent oxidoreductase [Actinomycetota bacterium]|nr:NADP-dependent oxidoreductase [Actinomycetota bacterium]